MIDILVLSIVFILFMAVFIFRKGVNFSRFTLFAFIVIMAIPKVNIIGGVNSVTTAGIRIDDLLLAVLLVVSVIKYWGRINKNINHLVILFALFVFVGCTSAIYAFVRGDSASVILGLLTILRYFEYFCFAIISSNLARSKQFKKLFLNSLRLLVVFLSFVGFLQVFGYANYYVSGSEAGNFFRGLAVSTFNGYYEYGCFMVLMTYFFLVNEYKWDYLFAGLCLSQVFLTGSRTSLLVIIIILIIFLVRKSFWCESIKVQRRYIITSFSLLVIGIIGLSVAGSLGYLSRIAETDPLSIINQFSIEWENRDFYRFLYVIRNNIDLMSIAAQKGDLSTNIRSLKWACCLDGFLMHPIIGYGAGVTQTMDGSYVKLLCETGIIGFSIWIVILLSFLRRCNGKKNYILGFVGVLLIGSVAIDMFEASKVMEFIWFMGGMMLANNNILVYKKEEVLTSQTELEVAYGNE